MNQRRTAVATAVLALALALTACGTATEQADASLTASNGDVINQFDATFAAEFLQHDAGALALVDMATDRQISPPARQFAVDLLAARGLEIETLATWLGDWGYPVPDTMRDHVNAGHGDGSGPKEFSGEVGADLPGMPSAADFDELATLDGAAFETRWLTLLAEHHRGALELAATEKERGELARVVSFAKEVTNSQADGLERVEAMLDD